ncbi:alpha/beta fold hydrolase, partial [Kribbia dieselivorans]|uniref:alpha/beta fold hydrolase n=1 Tax=Kribbia dieselivorans TaxID=331526 RepID=UPI00351EDA5D
GSEVDARWARQRAEGRHSEAGATSLEYIIDGPRWAPVRRAVGPIAGRLFASSDTPPGDLLVEVEAENTYDATDVLERIAVPVLIVCGAADRFFPVDEVRATAARIPDCSLILYPGLGHVRTLSSPRLYRDALEFLTA